MGGLGVISDMARKAEDQVNIVNIIFGHRAHPLLLASFSHVTLALHSLSRPSAPT